MDCVEWKTILIQWINCLKLVRPIPTLEDLRSGEFFINLMRTLDSPAQVQNMYDVVSLIQRSYPNFHSSCYVMLENETIESIAIFCSVLLHYSCVVKRNEAFIKVLCNSLPQNVQLNIRTFLEKFTCDMNSEKLKSVINYCIKSDSNEREFTYDWKPTGDSLLTGKSPLQNILTPQVQLKEKDQQIKKLQAELELERFEKANSLEEIEIQKKTIQQLGNLLKEKRKSISKLRDELSMMQNTSLPDCQKLPLCDTDKQLRLEVENLERYISQLRSEQDELQDDKEKILKQLKRSKEEAKLWQEKALSAENNSDEITEKYAQQTQELGQLRIHCNEMSALLEELRPLKKKPSYLDSPVLQKCYSICENSSEDLAHAIIEVQLKDAQNENTELQAALMEAVQRGDCLQKDLSTVSANYQGLQKSFTELQASNSELVMKISELHEAQTKLCDCNKELNSKVCELLQLNECKDGELSTLRVKLEDISISHREIASLNEMLQNDLKIKRGESDEIERKLCSVTDEYTNIRKEANALQEKYEALAGNYNESTFELNAWKENYELLDRNMSASLEKLERIIYGRRNIDFGDKSSAFAVMLQGVEDFKEQQKNLQNTVLQSEQQVSVLKQEILNLTQRETINRQQLEDSLRTAEHNSDNLKQIIAEKSEEIGRLNRTILELNGTIAGLSLLKQSLSEMQEEKRINEELHRNEVHDFHLKLSARDDAIKNYTNRQSAIDRELDEAKHEIQQFQEMERRARQDDLEKEKRYLEKTQLLNLQVQDYLERIAQLENDLSDLKEEYDAKVDELINLERTQEEVRTDYETTKSDLLKKNELITETVGKLEIELRVVLKEKGNLQKSLKDLASDNKQMTDDRNRMLKEAEDLKGQVRAYLEQIRNIEGDCAQKDTVISENNKELLNMKLELEAKKRDCKRLQESTGKLTLDAKSYVLCIDTLKAQNAEFNSKINELSNEIAILKNIKAGLESKNKEFESNTEKLIATLSASNEELNFAIRGLALDKQKSESVMQHLKALADEAKKGVEELTKERTSIVQKCEDNILLLTEEVTSLKNEVFDLKSREVECVHDLTSTKDELSKAVSKYADSLVLLQEVKSESECQITNLTENLHGVVEEYNKLESAHQESSDELKRVKVELEEAESAKLSLEVKIIHDMQKYEEEIELITEQLTNDIKNLSEKRNKLEVALQKAEDKLEKQRGVRYRLENDVEQLRAKLSELEQEKADLAETVNSLQRSKLQLDADYKALHLTYTGYISESENNIRKLETDCNCEIQKLNEERNLLEQQVTVLENAMSSLQMENDASRRFHEETNRNNDAFIVELKEKISGHEVNLAKITQEQNLLRQQVEIEKQNYVQSSAALGEADRRNEEERNSYEERISKLKCAYDILHTGKGKLEFEYQNLLETCDRIEQEKLCNETQLREKLKLNEDEIANLSKEVNTRNELISHKDAEIAEISSELHKMQLAIETLENEAAKSKEFHEDRLAKIEEENQSKIAEMSNQLRLMMRTHESLSEDNARLKAEQDRLKEETQAYLAKQGYLEECIREKEQNLNEHLNRIALREESATRQENLITGLRNDLENQMSEAELLKKEKLNLEAELEKTRAVVTALERSHRDIVESQEKTARETEARLLKAHEDAMKIKDELLETDVKAADAENARRTLEELLQKEKEAKEYLELRTLALANEKSKCTQLYLILRQSIRKISELTEWKVGESLEAAEENDLKTTTAEIEQRIAEVYGRQRNLARVISALQEDKEQSESKLASLEKERAVVNAEKEKLLRDYNSAVSEREAEKESLENLQVEMEDLRKRYEENLEVKRAFESNNNELQQRMLELKENNIKAYNEYQEFVGESRTYKQAFDRIANENATTEAVINELKKKLLDVQLKCLHLKPEQMDRQQLERKEALEVISEDIQKQFRRYSNILHRYQTGVAEISMKVTAAILAEKRIDWKKLLSDLDVEEVALKMEELKERASDAVEQCQLLHEIKSRVVLREKSETHVMQNVDWKKQEDEWRRKCNMLKQKLTLSENVKGNYEKKLKLLRDENKRLSAAPANKDDDNRYQVLLQQHTQAKEEHIKIIQECNSKYERLLHEHEKCKREPEETGKAENELKRIRAAYSRVLSENIKLERDRHTLQRSLDNQSSEWNKLKAGLSEANGKSEVREKVLKEKDEFIQALKKGIDAASEREIKRVQEVKVEYENKLEKMKEKMIKMYKEEVQREMEKLSSERADNAILLHSLERYKTELDEARQTISNLKRTHLDFYSSNGSSSARSSDSDRSVQTSKNKSILDGKRSTLPKGFSMTVIREDQISTVQATDMSHNLKMEDEGELFNNKYLSDLKEGKCVVDESSDSKKNRLMELMRRNSLCPPHLKSSYPAETQFSTPSLFKEDDVKSCNVDFDDSMSSKLLPGEKPRKKDIGTTSYKKPGPPTPSKNAGRLSLQGSEHVLREHNEPKTPKRTTPSRLRALFLGRNASAQDENQPNTPRTKRLNSIFRKPR